MMMTTGPEVKTANEVVRYVRFNNERDAYPKPEEGPLVDVLEEHERREQKKGMRAVSFVSYAPNSRRSKTGVEAVHLLVFDIDHVTVEQESSLRAALRGVACAIYSSYSHREDDRSFRLLLLLSREVTPDEFPRLWSCVKNHLPLKVDSSAQDVSRLWYLPSCPNSPLAEPFLDFLDGARLNVDAILDAAGEEAEPNEVAPARDGRASREVSRSHVEVGEGVLEGERNNALYSYGRKLRECGVAEAELRSRLRHENARACSPPLCSSELESLIRSVLKHELVEWSRPLPINASFKSGPPFPMEALPPWMREYVDAVSKSSCVSPILPAALALVLLSVGCGGRYRIRGLADHVEPLVLWIIVCLGSGERKSSVFKRMMEPAVSWERDEATRSANRRASDSIERDVLEARVRRLNKEAAALQEPNDRNKVVEEIRALRKELVALEPAEPRRLISADATPESVVKLLACNGGRLGLVSPEADVLEVVGGRYSPNRQPNLDALLKAHAGDAIRVDRVNSGAIMVDEPALTMGLTLQHGALRDLVGDSRFNDRGFVARFLFAVPPGRADLEFEAAESIPDAVEAEYQRRMMALLNDWDADCETLELDREALDEWTDFYQVSDRHSLDTQEEELKAWRAKYGGVVCRLAGLLAVARTAGERPVGSVEVGDVQNACMIGAFFLAHSEAVLTVSMRRESRDAEVLAQWLRDDKSREEFTVRDACRARAALGKKQIVAALGHLEMLGYLKRLPALKSVGGGRSPSPAYRVNPLWER